MRFPVCRFTLSAALLLLAACTEQKNPQTKQPPSAKPTPPADTTAAIPASRPTRPDTAYMQDIAAYLAGQPVSSQSALRPLTTQPAWQLFAADADKSWAQYHATRTNKIESWAATELDSVRASSSTIFYPFSGPDLLNAVTMFPDSKTYVLLGLEPVGSVPSRSTLENPKLFPALKAALWSVLNFSFFRTNDMAVELNSSKVRNSPKPKLQLIPREPKDSLSKTATSTTGVKAPKPVMLDGVLPVMMLFATRTGHQVQNVRYVQLNTEGELTDADSTVIQKPGPKVIPGVELIMLNKAGAEQKVYYFSADISDWKMGSNKDAVIQYAKSLGDLTTYVKSATYLMHKPYFSKVRNLILERSNYVLQDDSGIALKYFRPSDWQLTYYGTYKRPINLFAKHYQPAMTMAYADTIHRPRPLPFGTGYNWRQNDSNLLLARRQRPM
ncbi:hypothetical protein [Hymenobacter volaticus]|uniref:Uncharacterized protein n=1 Tax=Hymenobacter volaticus TaxID=2932254 RepID=A0ABY4G7U7_9BACT|nr:hypothetical protein [Hymenobacter volaticus]UOQ66826.1 hypothetical protein MUN86_02585 [Hymenobacter volaticus]